MTASISNTPTQEINIPRQVSNTPFAAQPFAAQPAEAQVFIMKEGGLEYILNCIRNAKTRIYIKAYIFTDVDGQITDELIMAKQRGVEVCVMIEPDPFFWEEAHPNPSYKIVKKLKQAGIAFKATNPSFSEDTSSLTHEKSLIIDNIGIILTGNLSRSNFTQNMDMGVTVIDNPDILYQMQTVFIADWQRNAPFSFSEDWGLVVGPQMTVGNQTFSAKDRILTFIYFAKSSVHLLNQTLSDTDILNALLEQKKRGLNVHVILADPNKVESNQSAVMFLKQNGISVSILKEPYLHAKAVSLDALDKYVNNNLSFIGSHNFTSGGLERNREMGLIFYDPQAAVEQVFRYCTVISSEAGRTYLLSHAQFKETTLELINLSKGSVVIAGSSIEDKEILESLTAAGKRGVKVKIIPNNKINGTVIVFDEKISIISPGALREKIDGAFEAAVSCDEAAVGAIAEQLNKIGVNQQLADAKGVLFPKNENKEKILNLINRARTTIYIESSAIKDNDIIKSLTNKAKEGVTVKVILKDKKENIKTSEYLKSAGAYVELLSAIDSKNNILLIDSDHVFISAVSFDDMGDFSIINNEVQVIQKADENFRNRWKIASIDQFFKGIILHEEDAAKWLF